MSVDQPVDTDENGAEFEADTRNQLIDLAGRLSAVDGPLVGDGDADEVEDIVYRMFEAVGGRRVAEVDDDQLVVEAAGDDTEWRKYTSDVTGRARCGPFHVCGSHRDDDVDIQESFVEILPAGENRGAVTLDVNLSGLWQKSEWEQGALHQLTPRQARSLAAGLLEQADRVEDSERKR